MLTVLERCADYPKGVFGTLLDNPTKLIQWDSIFLLKSQLDASLSDFFLQSFQELVPYDGV